MSNSSSTLDSASLLSSSNTPTRSCFDTGRLSLSSGSHISRSRLESYSKLYDIGTIAQFAKYLNGQDMLNVFNNVYKLPANYAFPQHMEGQGSHKRSFQSKWLHEYTWLPYSREDGGYCVPCVFFCKDLEGLGKLVNSPLIKFKDAVNTLNQHSKKCYHMHAVSDMLMFMQVMNNEQQPIDHQLVSALVQQVQTNRQLLNSII